MNSSTWRVDDLTVQAGECEVLNFHQTQPNMYYIQNANKTILKVGISHMPTSENYEFMIGENQTETFGRPIGSMCIYILNDGTVPANVKVFSIEKDFDMSVLKNLTVKLDGAKVITDGIVKGFSSGASIPSGTNLIGKVDLGTDTATTIFALNELLTSIDTTLDGTMTSIKNNQIGCTDNTRDILWQLDGRLSDNESRRQLLKEIADNSNSMISGNIISNVASASADLKTLAESGVSVNVENVNVSPDIFYKETEGTEVFSFCGKMEPTTKNDDRYFVIFPDADKGTASNKKSILLSTGQNVSKCDYYLITDPKGNKTLHLSFPNTNMLNYAASVDKVIGSIYAVKLKATVFKDLFDTMKSLGVHDGLNTYIVSTDKSISGILHDWKRVKDRSFSKTVTVNSNSSITISNDENPKKIFDRIDRIQINTEGASVTVRIYYTFSDYVDFLLTSTTPITDLEIPVYKVTIINDITGAFPVTVLGGLY